jgi:hypothetical protein
MKEGRRRINLLDCVEKVLRNLGVINWRATTEDGYGWRKLLEQAKTQINCSGNNNNKYSRD